jgi:CBS domain-containing protein
MSKTTRVEDIMTVGCETIDEHDSILNAAKKMSRLDVGALPICDRNRNLKGMLTDRDIVTQVVSAGLDPAKTQVGKLGGDTTVVISEEDDLDRAVEIMAVQQVRRLPVVDRKENVVGLISQADIATHAGPRQSGAMLASISQN